MVSVKLDGTSQVKHGFESRTRCQHWINVARQELGDLAELRDVLDHYHRRGAGVRPISAQDAATEYIELRKTDRLNLATQHDISWRLRAFEEYFGKRHIRTLEEANAMLSAGANRLGCSNLVAIGAEADQKKLANLEGQASVE